MLLANRSYTASCRIDFCKEVYSHGVMKADLRISIKDYHRKKNYPFLQTRQAFSYDQLSLGRMRSVPPAPSRLKSEIRGPKPERSPKAEDGVNHGLHGLRGFSLSAASAKSV